MENSAKLPGLTTHITIEMSGETRPYLVSAKQGDKATRYIEAKLLNSGEAYVIPDDAIAVINIKKPDGKYIYNSCEHTDDVVTVELTNQALAAAGTAYCDIEIRTNDNLQIISTASFTIEIEESMRNEGAIQSANEFTAIENRIAGHISSISETEAAVRTAETERVNNESRRIEQEGQRQEETERAIRSVEEATEAARTATEDCIDMMNSSSETVRGQVETIKEAGNNEIQRINNALEVILPEFTIDFETGDLLYRSERFIFIVNEDGDLEWRLIV